MPLFSLIIIIIIIITYPNTYFFLNKLFCCFLKSCGDFGTNSNYDTAFK
jgi:hypothetical protein